MTFELPPITAVSSMATKALLAELTQAYQSHGGRTVAIASMGGVDAAARVTAGESFDVVVLARDAIEKLVATGHLLADSLVDLVRSEVAVAVPAGAERPDIGTEEALRRAVQSARTIGYSTGPSGVRLAGLFQRWGIATQIQDRVVVPPPGIPVGRLVARGEIALGFQQRSELVGIEGLDVLGPLPAAVQIVTTFTAAVGARTQQPEAARVLLAFLASPLVAETKRRHGMEPVDR